MGDNCLVIFDKDGVLFNTEPEKTRSYWLALEDLNRISGQDLLGQECQENYLVWHAENLTGGKRPEVVSKVLEKFGAVGEWLEAHLAQITDEILAANDKEAVGELKSDKLPTPVQRVFSALRIKLYNQIPLPRRCPPIGKMIDALRFLDQAGIPVALITESELSRTLAEFNVNSISLEIFVLLACTDGIIDGRTGEKLAPGGKKSEMYERIAALTQTELASCWSIEDTDKGRDQALKAGVSCLQVFFPPTPAA